MLTVVCLAFIVCLLLIVAVILEDEYEGKRTNRGDEAIQRSIDEYTKEREKDWVEDKTGFRP